ncbi:MAG: crossover junction endodeoxyribonuclease RuvC [Sphaerochaetaceae bacterium]|nr:crossover junction endodeoxyribonuclease RuvC [Sphaerochaetaceae bacterium]
MANTGWGVVDFDGHRFQPVCYGTVKTEPGDALAHRIALIADNVGSIAKEYCVQHMSIEDIFFAKNEISAIGVAKVIGAVCYAMYLAGIQVHIYTPMQLKLAITGNGRSDKKAVQEMCRILMGLDKIPRPDHAADALAAAVCFGNTEATMSKFGVKR